MIERQLVVAGKGGIGDQCGADRQKPAFQGNRREAGKEIVQRETAQLVIERMHRRDDRRQPDDGPEIRAQPAHTGIAIAATNLAEGSVDGAATISGRICS
ncbi:hypothetical protein D9M69_674270 [compost metagenome]